MAHIQQSSKSPDDAVGYGPAVLVDCRRCEVLGGEKAIAAMRLTDFVIGELGKTRLVATAHITFGGSRVST